MMSSGHFAAAELHVVRNLADCAAAWVPEPTCIEQPAEFGLYRLDTLWQNPQYGRRAGPPAYAMPYDAGSPRSAANSGCSPGRRQTITTRFANGSRGAWRERRAAR